MGVAAPRAAWANIVVNGESYGLFGMAKQVDGRFTDSRWSNDGNGNLHKEAWRTSEDLSEYVDSLETNSEIADHRAILELASALSAQTGSKKSVAASTLSQWMSLEYLRRYTVTGLG